jgi:hypothetical protein
MDSRNDDDLYPISRGIAGVFPRGHPPGALRIIETTQVQTPIKSKRNIAHSYIQSPFIEQVMENDLKIKNEPREKLEMLRQKR